MNQRFISNCRGFRSESHKWFLTYKSRSMFKENSMCSSILGQGRTTWLRTSSVSSCWEPICSSFLYEGWTIISVHDPLVQYYTCPIVYLLFTDALLWTTSYTCYTTNYLLSMLVGVSIFFLLSLYNIFNFYEVVIIYLSLFYKNILN